MAVGEGGSGLMFLDPECHVDHSGLEALGMFLLEVLTMEGWMLLGAQLEPVHTYGTIPMC